MAILIGIPILIIAVILQSVIASQIRLLNGTADLVLLTVVIWIMRKRVKVTWEWAILAGVMVGFISALPFWVPIVAYLVVTAMGLFLKQRVWQIPILALFTAIFFATLTMHAITVATLRFLGTPLDLVQVFNLVTLPGLLLNLLLAIPINGVVGEISAWIYPEEELEA